jgi:hypothetical protein
LIYLVIHILTYILVIHVLSKPHLKNHDNKSPEFIKYKAFARKDVNNWSIIWNFPFYITFWPRLGMAFLNVIVYSSFVITCMLGVDWKNPDIGAVRKNLIGYAGYVSCRLHGFLGGLMWV